MNNKNEFDQRVYDQAVDYLYRNIGITTLGMLFIHIILFFIFWPTVDHTLLTIWMAFGITLYLLRYILYRRFQRKKNEITDKQRWGNYFSVYSLIIGILWGLAFILFFTPESIVHQFALLTVVVGVSAGSILQNAYWLKGTLFIAIPSHVLAASRIFYEGQLEYYLLGIGVIVYLLLITWFAYYINKSMLETIKVQLNNYDLSKQYLEQKEAAEQANISKSKFLASASHDLRQPLHALSLFTDVLDQRIKDKEDRETISNIKQSVGALETLFNALLDISKLDAGVIEPKIKTFLLSPLLLQLQSEYAPQANKKGLDWKYDAKDHIVKTDPTLLETILRNLISNAIRYTQKGQIEIHARNHEGRICIEVIDTGLGIPADQCQNIFREFYQLSNPERDRTKGLGLGLAIVERMSRLLGYELNIASEFGKGTTFSILVPEGQVTQLTESTLEQPDSTGEELQGTLVVVIDDEKIIRKGMSELLESWGCQVVSAGSEDEVLFLLNQSENVPDVLIADYRLRNGQIGVEAIKNIQAKYDQAIPAVVISGDTAPQRLVEVQESGYPLLHKPVAASKLRVFIQNAVRKKL